MSDPSAENPYQPPPDVDETAPLEAGTVIEYDAAATKDDLRRALRSGPAMVWDVILLVTLGLGVTAVVLSQMIGGGWRAGWGNSTFTFLILLIPTLLAGFGLYRKWFAAEIYLKHYPRALQRRTGQLTEEGFLLCSEEGKAWWPHTSLLRFKQHRDQLTICYDLRGASQQILPERGFSDPLAAAAIFSRHAQRNPYPPLGVFDHRALQPLSVPIRVGPMPEGAIRFSGTLQSGDLVDTPLLSLQLHSLLKSLGILVVLHFAALAVYHVYGRSYAVLAILPLALLDVWFALVFYRTWRPRSVAQQPLMLISGWLDEDGLTLLNDIEQSVTRWTQFSECEISDSKVWLRFDSGSDLLLLLHRRFFDSDADWQATQQLLQTHVGPARPPTTP
ncbi:hypothetical protein [Roseimaritima ulvae]|uniref:YcxB-like protein domain-containing protein n=1 Tax=Roseimaritima ulvae TaxID=980254 RepID=A0A5B9R7J7_9BACT|nr:hypothetical protein [Roseimaritima ulvae]QEG42423.1 hypothetical protein UC8_44620 [Roseimaritima ulvae]